MRILTKLLGIGGQIEYCVAFVDFHSGLIAANYRVALGAVLSSLTSEHRGRKS